jgi:hypothetical protein
MTIDVLIFFVITMYVASVIISLMGHAKINYEQNEKGIKRFTILMMFLPIVNVVITINLLMTELSSKNYRIESLKIDKNYLNNLNQTLNNRLEKVTTENIIKNISVGDSFRIPNTDEWVGEVRGKICKIVRISDTHVHHTVEGTSQNYKTKIEVMSDMIFINRKGVMPFRFLS